MTQQLQLPAKACAVITNGRLLWVVNPKDTSNTPPGGVLWLALCSFHCFVSVLKANASYVRVCIGLHNLEVSAT